MSSDPNTQRRLLGFLFCAMGAFAAVLGWIHARNASTAAETSAGTQMMFAGSAALFVSVLLLKSQRPNGNHPNA